jgi:maltose alpha-D-glucosyltransferase / alpha-amylase
VNQHLFYALASGDVRTLADALKQTRALPPSAQWGHFLRNHDELDLGRLTEEQRAVVFERFGKEPDMQLYDRGIRRRLASMLGERAQIELAYSLLFSLPGTPVIRYGDEIGMGDDLKQKERDAVRTPMQWSNERNAGFSAAKKIVKPIVDDGPFGHRHVNVEAQRRDAGSLLNWTARMIRMRKECPEIGWGEWTLPKTGSSKVLAIHYTWRGNAVVVVHNFDGGPREARFKIDAEGDDRLANLMVDEELRPDERGVYKVALEAYGYRWYRVGGLGYALRSGRDSGAGVKW